MGGTSTDFLNKLVDGLTANDLANASSLARSQRPAIPPTLVKMVIIEAIADPTFIVDKKKKDYWSGVIGVSNVQYADQLPRNTVIAQELNGRSRPLFCFPFFPSHLALPSKAGEVIWVVYENPNADSIDLAYWMCKVTQPHFVDDVNHTHMARIHEPSYVAGTVEKGKNDGKPDAWHELRNSPVQTVKIDGKSARTSTAQQQYIVSSQDDVFETIVMETDAGRMTQYEAVPRFKKRPGDLALEGSNNTLIVLGTDRSGQVAELSEDDNQLYVQKSTADSLKKSKRPVNPSDDLQGSAGSIDLVVGRGQTVDTFGAVASTTRIKDSKSETKGSVLKKELDKVVDLKQKEGDPDFANDRSRILLSQRTKAEQKFGTADYNKQFKRAEVKDEPAGEAAVIIKSDKVKILARSDVQLVVVGSVEATSPAGQAIKKDATDTSKWASITIKSNGDIVFTPSKEGVIKLGGDDANLAVLCSTSPNFSDTKGNVKGTPIGNNAGGANGLGPATGTGEWATKILVK